MRKEGILEKVKRLKILILIVFISLLETFYFLLQTEGVEKHPKQKVISLGPTITESLYLLGAQDQLIANTIYCKRPSQAQYKIKIGTVVKMDLEKVISLSPHLVLATSLSNPEQIEKLRDLGIKVVSFNLPQSFSEICSQFLELGRLVGKKEKAEDIVRRVKEKVSLIQKRVKDLQKPKVLVQVGAKPLWVATKESFINDLIEKAGGINIGPSGKDGLYSREEVIMKNPDIIIIVPMGIVGREEKEIWKRYKTINAVKKDRIYVIDRDDSNNLCRPTPVNFVKALEKVTNILHSSY